MSVVLSNGRYERTFPCRDDRTIGFRMPESEDAPALWALAGAAGLDVNSHYAYAMWGEYFADTSVVAEAVPPNGGQRDGDQPAGFVLGFRPPRAVDTLFVWQVAVAAGWRGVGLATRMIDQVVARCGATCVEATVTPSNTASAALFRGLGGHDPGRTDEALAFAEDLFPDGHEAEIRFRVRVDARLPTIRERPTERQD